MTGGAGGALENGAESVQPRTWELERMVGIVEELKRQLEGKPEGGFKTLCSALLIWFVNLKRDLSVL